MTIASTTVQTSGSTGNGVTTVFSFSFNLDPNGYGSTTAASQVQVIKETIATGAESVLTLTTDYTVSVNSDQASSPGGSITMVSAPSSAYKIWIRLNPDFTQQTDYQNQGGFLMETVEDQADQQGRQIITLLDRTRRTPRAGVQAGTAFDGEIAGDLSPGAVPGLKSDLSGYQWYANNGSSSAVTASGATTAITLADRFGRQLTPEDFGAVGDGATNDSTALQAWLDCGDTFLTCSGTYGVGTMLTIPAGVFVDASGATFKPTGNNNVFRLHGGAKLCGYPTINVTGVSGWNSVCVLFDGSSYATAANQFLMYRKTLAEVRCLGSTTSDGTNGGTGVKFLTADDGVNNQWIMNVHVFAVGQGFDKAVWMVKAGSDVSRTFVNYNHILFDWGSCRQSLVMESGHASTYSVDGNYIAGHVQTRSSATTLTVAPWVVVGQTNHIQADQVDWVGGNGGSVAGLTLAAGARSNRIDTVLAPAYVTNSSTERTNTIDYIYHTGGGRFVGQGLPTVIKASAPASRGATGFDGDVAIDANFFYAYRTTNTWEQFPTSNWQVLARSFAAVSHTGDTSTFTFATIAVPANAMGANGVLRITTIWSYPNSGNAKTLLVTFGGNTIFTTAPTTTSLHQSIVTVGNRNATNSQIVGNNTLAATGGFGNTGGSIGTLATDTTSAQNILLKGTLANSGETLTLEGYMVELSYGA